ncbi:MAG: hypothetical protein ACOC3T_03665, partial [Bacteroidota bacterium]
QAQGREDVVAFGLFKTSLRPFCREDDEIFALIPDDPFYDEENIKYYGLKIKEMDNLIHDRYYCMVRQNQLMLHLMSLMLEMNHGIHISDKHVAEMIDKQGAVLFVGPSLNNMEVEELFVPAHWSLKKLGAFKSGKTISFADVQEPELILFDSAHTFSPLKKRKVKMEARTHLVNKIAEPALYDLKIIAERMKDHHFRDFYNNGFSIFDRMVSCNNLSVNFSSDAPVFSERGTNKGWSIALANQQEFLKADMKQGLNILIQKALRKVLATGAQPFNVSGKFSFPGLPNSMEEFQDLIEHFVFLAKENEFESQTLSVDFLGRDMNDLTPQLHVAVTGFFGNINKQVTTGFKEKGDMIYLIGQMNEEIDGRWYLDELDDRNKFDHLLPWVSSDYNHQSGIVQGLIAAGLIRSLNSIKQGGVWFALLQSALENRLGFDVTTLAEMRQDAFLFNESVGRMIVSVTPDLENQFVDFMMLHDYPVLALGHVTKEELRVDDLSFGFIDDVVELCNERDRL